MNGKTLFKALAIAVGVALMLLPIGRPAHAQDGRAQCVDLVDKLQAAIADCDDINSNWACYGSIEAGVVPVQYRFQSLRDRRPLTVLEELDTDKDGVVFLNLHLEGETNPIRAMMFGDGTLEATAPGRHSYIMAIDDSTELCEDTPPGMVLHTEEGASGTIELNGVAIELGSTAFVTFTGDDLMTIVNLEGQVSVAIDGVVQVLPVGFQTQVTVDGTPTFATDPFESPYDASVVLRWVTDNDDGIRRIHNTNLTDDACIQEINIGETLTGQVIANPGHECLYRLCTDSAAPFSLQMESTDGGLDPWLDLRGPDDLLVAYNNDVDASQSDVDSALCSVGLPQPACYTVVARAGENASAGAFTIRVDGGNTCPTPTVPRCDVRVHQGLNLRAEPTVESQVLRTLAQNTHLTPVARSQDESWLRVQITGENGETDGWVRNLPQFVQCEIQTYEDIEKDDSDSTTVVDCDTARGLQPEGCVKAAEEPKEDVNEEEEEDDPRPDKSGPFGAP